MNDYETSHGETEGTKATLEQLLEWIRRFKNGGDVDRIIHSEMICDALATGRFVVTEKPEESKA